MLEPSSQPLSNSYSTVKEALPIAKMFTKYLGLAIAAMACFTAASPAPDQALSAFTEQKFSYVDVLEYWKSQGAQPSKIEGEGNETTRYWTFDKDQYDTAIKHLTSTTPNVARSPVGSSTALEPRNFFESRSESWYYKVLCDQTGVKWKNALVASAILGDICSYVITYTSHLWVVHVIEKYTRLQDERNRWHNVYVKVGWAWEQTSNVNAAGVCSGGLAYLINNRCEVS